MCGGCYPLQCALDTFIIESLFSIGLSHARHSLPVALTISIIKRCTNNRSELHCPNRSRREKLSHDQVSCTPFELEEINEESLFLLNSEYRSEFKILKHLLVTLQASFRKANIHSQMNINLKNKSELLYNNSAEMEVRSRKGKSQDDVIKMSKSMTSQLSDISQHLASIIDQSKNTVETLVQSSQTVSDTQEEFKVMGSAIVTAKKLVSRYGRREVTDMILIVLAACFFFACCVYVILKRMF
nr:EOG090X0EO1 [Sida crystallina]